MRKPNDTEHKGCESVIHDYDRAHFVNNVRGKDLLDCDQGDFRCRRTVDQSSFS